jgi:hypothetical protein
LSRGARNRCAIPTPFVFAIFALSVFCAVPVLAKDSRQAGNLLDRMLVRMEQGEISEKDIRTLEKLADGGDRFATAMLAQHHGEITGDVHSALKLLSPILFEAGKANDILRLCSAKKVKAEEILSQLPPPSAWKKGEPLTCVALARILAANGRTVQAAEGFDLVGMNHQGVPQTLAAEGVGDMMLLLKQWTKSVDAFTFALKCLSWMRTQSEHQDGKDSLARMEARIRRKLDKAQACRDSERYGPEFVAYREARRAEFDGGSALAAVLYADLREKYPGTVYSEAAGLYGANCLLDLAASDAGKKLNTKTAEIEKRLSAEKERLKKSSGKMAERIRQDWAGLISEDESLLARLKAIPVGAKAEKTAVAAIAAFVAENEFGLYRGEALLRLGDHHLENLEIEKAHGLYDRAARWLEENARIKAAVATSFAVPEKAAAVTWPPTTMHSTDGIWGNTRWSAIAPEGVFNQNTCGWYFDWLRYGVHAKRGLCSYLLGKKDAALGDITVIIAVSPFEKAMFERKSPNSYSRLKNAFENDTMFATREELQAFKGKARTAMIVAGFHYEIEDWTKAYALFTRYRERFGKSSDRNTNAYLDYVIGNLHLIRGTLEGNKDLKRQGVEMLAAFGGKEYERTPTWPRGVLALFSQKQGEKGKQEYALDLLRRIHREMPDSDYGKRAYYHQGEYLFNVLRRRDEAKGIFEDIAAKYPGTWLARGAGQYLDKISKSQRGVAK